MSLTRKQSLQRVTLNNEEIAAYEEAFNIYDKNGDGTISFEELKEIFSSCGEQLSDEALREAMRTVDKDGNGNLDFQEFIEMMEMKLTLNKINDPDEELREVFRFFDRDNDGQISAQEIFTVLSGLGQKLSMEEIHLMIKDADNDSDGFVDFEEFKCLMKMR